MKRVLILFLAFGFVACAAGVANAVVLIGGATNNGYFDETGPVLINDQGTPDPSDDFYLPHPTVWTYEGSRAITGPYNDALSSEPWAGPAPTPVTTGGTGAPPRPEGCGGADCGVFFKAFTGNATNGAATGHLYQDHPGTPGMYYRMTGWAGAEANFLAAGAEIALEFLDSGGGVIGGEVVNLLPTLYVDNGEPFDYKKYAADGVAPAGTATVRARVSMIEGMPNPAGGGQAYVVDDFTLICVPEPASAALGLIGLIGIVGLVRRR